MITLIHIIATTGSVTTLLAAALYRPNRVQSHRRYWKRQDRKERND